MIVSIGNHENLLRAISQMGRMVEEARAISAEEHRILEEMEERCLTRIGEVLEREREAEMNVRQCQGRLAQCIERVEEARSTLDDLTN